MSRTDPAILLEHIARYAGIAARIASRYTPEKYAAAEEARLSVERALEICGEALKKLRDSSPELAKQVADWKGVIGFRNLVAHGYAELDDARVHQIATRDAPGSLPMRKNC
ncbi:MAG: HepT-like ribonuclease domain-containing protein [Pseudomonadota bacterium]